MRRALLHYFVLFPLLLLLFSSWLSPAYAQEAPAEFHIVDPAAAPPDTELEVTIFGRGLSLIQDMVIESDAIQLLDWQAVTDERIVARIFVSPGAAPGPRDLLIRYVLDDAEFRAFMPAAFEVLPTQAPTDGPAEFHSFDPASARPDEELQVTIFGRGFRQLQDMAIESDAIRLLDWQAPADNRIAARIAIPADASPGPRDVLIHYVLDDAEFRAFMPNAFEILPQAAPPSGAQFRLFGVAPDEGEPGEQLEIRLLGEGFVPAQDFQVNIVGVELLNQVIESDDTIRARIFIPEDAPAGPRPVSLTMVKNDVPAIETLQEGFNVTTGGIPPTLVWPIITIALCAASYAFGRSLALRSKPSFTRQAKAQWQLKAENKLPQPRKVCEWACKGTVDVKAFNRWQVKRIELTPLDAKRKTPPARKVDDPKVLASINELMNLTDFARSAGDVRDKLTPAATALLHEFDRWEHEGQSPASVRLEARLAGSVKVDFGLYHCEQTSTGLAWTKDPLVKWSKNLNQPAGKHLGVLRGPMAGEADFRNRAYSELKDCLEKLVTSTRLWP